MNVSIIKGSIGQTFFNSGRIKVRSFYGRSLTFAVEIRDVSVVIIINTIVSFNNGNF